MKLRNLFFAAVAMTIMAAGCTKQDIPSVSEKYKVEFSVSDKGGFNPMTKAVKNTWAAGDQIAIFCKPDGRSVYLADNAKIIYLKYNGSAWSTSDVSAELATELGMTGDFSAIHYRVSATENISLANDKETFDTFDGGEILFFSNKYTMSAGTLSLGEITMALFENTSYAAGQLFQVSVKNLNASDGWTMSIANNTYTPSANNVTESSQLAHTGTYSGLYRFVSDNGTIGTWGGFLSDQMACSCVQNGNDISFVFCNEGDLENIDANKKYHFYLTNGTDVYTYTIDRGIHDGVKFEKNLEIGHAYLLPALTEEGKWTKR